MNRYSPWLLAALAMLAGGSLAPHLMKSTVPEASLSKDATPDVTAPSRSVELLVAELLGLPAETASDAVIRDAKAYFGAGLKVIIATTPDPVDSSNGWFFDGIAAAIQASASSEGYVLARFELPGSAKGDDKHQTVPGTLIFRKDNIGQDGRNVQHHLLVVLLVPETPSGGLHERAMRTAVKTAASWTAAPEPIRILGPTFSGSSVSVAHALRGC